MRRLLLGVALGVLLERHVIYRLVDRLAARLEPRMARLRQPLADCPHCQGTGNDPSTGWQHPQYDELGCPLCNEPDGMRCCRALPTLDWTTPITECARCGHPVVPA